jgi:hypothetical protein
MSTAVLDPLQAQPLPDRLYDAIELARIFKVHRNTLLQWARDGVIPPGRRFGGTIRWTPADLAPLLGQRDG